MFPLETIRTRLAVDPKKYRNMLGAFQTIIEAEGAGALYRVRTCMVYPVSIHSPSTWTGLKSNLLCTRGHKLKTGLMCAGPEGQSLGCHPLLSRAPGIL